MSKKIRSTLKIWIQKKLLRAKGVVIHHDTVFSGVNFMGKAVIEPYCRLIGDHKIIIGHNFYMNVNCHILGNITFGQNVIIGPKTVIWGRDHGMELDKPMKEQKHKKLDIKIHDDVWIGANVTILKGVEISKGAVIGAGAVVTKNISEYGVAVGNPAKVIKYRK
jgi:maltose O-acetyltransferase